MAFPPQLDILSLLYEQYRTYTATLGQTQQKLSKQYKKLSKIERVLSQREERHLSRDERKKYQYSRVLTKRTVSDLESQQAGLHDHLRQCSDLIASFENGTQNSPMTPWTAQAPPTPFLFTPFSPVFTPYTPDGHRPSFNSPGNRPQYWDLSMLAEPQERQRCQFSPYASTADSGYHEPQLVGLAVYEQPLSDPNHVFAHELMSPFVYNMQDRSSSGMAESSERTDSSERDVVPDLQRSPVSPARVGAQSSHKRCYSANAVQLNQSHLASPASKRGTSVGPLSSSRRNTDGGLDNERKEAEKDTTE